MENFIHLLHSVQQSYQKCVLATIIHIDGSAYLREGNSMLIMENGECIGILSPGCLEEDLVLRSKEVLLSQTPQTISYDLRSTDDLGWGQGIGCNGIMRILLEPITENYKHDLHSLLVSLENGHSVIRVKEFSDDFILKNSTFYFPHQLEYKEMMENIFPETSRLILLDNVYKSIHIYKPSPVLVVFGAGEDAKPLVSIALNIGFKVLLCDWRPGYCNEQHIPSANQYIIGSPKVILDSIDFSNQHYVVIMSHSFIKDQEFLTSILKKDVHYVGVMGSKKRTQQLLGEVKFPSNLFSPIGLSIGAQGPNEIAVSIMAEIVQKFRES
ncbi:XdhC family protein [Bacillus sp. CGMCC 1.16607]|uniref:XdhC family protein n=1 Tax=Bacillus sp. CGMCC 1.16607 TaxID=3351842 RepID=UPI00363D87E5